MRAQAVLSFSTITSGFIAANIMMAYSEYLSWNDPKVEPKLANETELQIELHEIIIAVQKHSVSLHHHWNRAVHVTTQGLVKGTFQVAPNLPSHLVVYSSLRN